MVGKNIIICPVCFGHLKHYDNVRRIVRTEERHTRWIKLRRLKCTNCGRVHRELPNYIIPYKQYEKNIIIDILEGSITYETIGYEDYPCEMTMNRWISQKDIILISSS